MTMQWITEDKPRALGALSTTKNAQAKALLASWNSTDGNQCINEYGLQAADTDAATWGNRDGWVLSCFTNWWIVNKKVPTLPQPGTKDGAGWVNLDDLHLYALQKWGIEKGAINTGQAIGYCEYGCQLKYANDPSNLAQCLQICGGQPPMTCPPGQVLDPVLSICKPIVLQPTCPPGQVWNGTQCVFLITPPTTPICPPGQVWNGSQCVFLITPPTTPLCPPGQVLDVATNTCKAIVIPGPVRPAPTPPGTAPAKPETNNAGVVLGVLGGVALLGLIVNMLIKVPAPPAMQANAKKSRSNPGPTRRTGAAPIANPCDYDWSDELYYFSLGAYGSTHVYVWANSADDAMEEMVEWVDDNAPGLLSTIGESDYEEAAEELGLDWKQALADEDDNAIQEITQKAEADMYMVGHTTLDHGNAMPSWEIHFNEVGGAKREAVKRLSQIECEDEGPLPLPEA